MPSLKSLSLSVAVLRAFVLLIHYVTVWPWPLTLNAVVCQLSHGQTLIWAKSDNPRRSYCSFNIWPYDLEHVSHVALCSGIVCTKFKLIQAIRWHVVTVCTKFNRNRTIPAWVIHNLANFCLSYTSRCNFYLWPLDLELLWSFGQSYWRFSYFFASGLTSTLYSEGWTKLYQIWREQSYIIDAPTPKLW